MKNKIPFVTKPRDRLKSKLRLARTATNNVVSTMTTFTDEELMNSYLIEIFLLNCLPESLRYFAMKYFLSDNDFYSEWREKGFIHSIFNRFCIVLIPLYLIMALIVIIVLGNSFFFVIWEMLCKLINS